MVIVLANHFAQVTFAIVSISGSLGHDVDDGDFFPGQHTEFVAHLQESIILRVMGDTDKVGTHLFHQFHVTAVHFVGQRHTDGFLVLVAADTAKLVGFSVEEESFIGIEVEPPEAGVMVALIQDHFSLAVTQGGFYPVEGRCFGSP